MGKQQTVLEAAQPSVSFRQSVCRCRHHRLDGRSEVRKISGFNKPLKANEAAFNRAVEEVASAARDLLASLVTSAAPRDREVEAMRARARAAARFGTS